MTDRSNIYAACFFALIGVASLLLAMALVQRRRHTRAVDSLIILVLAISIWCTAYAMSFARVSIDVAEMWLDATYLGALSAPTAMLFFVARYTRSDRWITEFRRHMLLMMPFLFAVGIYVPPFRQFFLGDGRNHETAVLDHPGLTYWVYLAYVSGLMAIATVIVVRHVRTSAGTLGRTGPLLLIAMALPWGASIVSSANVTVWELDPTVLSLAVTTCIFAYLVLSERILDVRGLARREMLSVMLDGFLALDEMGNIVEASDRALSLLELDARDVLHKSLHVALAPRPEVLRLLDDQGGGLLRLGMNGPHERLISVDVLPLSSREGKNVGSTIVFRDQTNLYLDELTKIGNRRYFFDQIPTMVALCQRSGVAVSLAIIDLDGLKSINDAFGHLGGDQALANVARAITTQVRTVDVVGRMGGDEFVVLLPSANEAEAASIIERVRAALSETSGPHHVTVSAGVAEIASTDSVLHAIAAADRALYRAKELGRDRLVRFTEVER